MKIPAVTRNVSRSSSCGDNLHDVRARAPEIGHVHHFFYRVLFFGTSLINLDRICADEVEIRFFGGPRYPRHQWERFCISWTTCTRVLTKPVPLFSLDLTTSSETASPPASKYLTSFLHILFSFFHYRYSSIITPISEFTHLIPLESQSSN